MRSLAPPVPLALAACTTLVLLTGALAFPGAAHAGGRSEDRLSIAALELDDRGAGPETAKNVSALVATELARYSGFRIVSSEDVKRMISVEERKQLMGCGDTTCIAEIAGALGVEWIVAGGVGKVGTTYVLSLQLINQHQARVESREDAKGDGPGALVDALRPTVERLVRPLLKVHEGTLAVKSNEQGATVKVDDRVIGTTPLRATTINWGPHAILIQKDGFIAWQKDVEIGSGEAMVVDTTLIPSAEFIEKYRSRNHTLRNASYAAFISAAVAGGVATYFWVKSGDYKDEQDRLGKNICVDGTPPCPVTGSTIPSGPNVRVDDAKKDAFNHAGQQSTDAVTTTNIVAFAVATPLALTGLVLFLVSDDPNRYDRYSPETGEGQDQTSSLHLFVTPSSAALSYGFGF